MSDYTIPLMPENQSYSNMNGTSTPPAGYQPTDEEKKLIKHAYKCLDKSKKHRAHYDPKWVDYYKMYRGKQWKEQRPSFRHSEVINLIWSSIQSIVPVLTDNRPKFEYLPEDPMDLEFSQIMNEVAESDWNRYNWSMALVEMIYDGHIIGNGIGKIGFNAKARSGLGAATFCSEDPFYCFPDPDAVDINNKSRYWITATPTNIEILKEQYPDKADFIKPDVVDYVKAARWNLDQIKYKSPTDNKAPVAGFTNYEDTTSNEVLKIELYYKCDDFDEEEIDKEDGTKEYSQKLKYPNGRKLCVASGVLLDDVPLPPSGDHPFPYFKYTNYVLPREFWGESDVEHLESPQKILNKLISFWLDTITLMGNPIWIVDENSGIDTDNIFNRPGEIYEKTPGSEVRREQGIAVNPDIIQLIDRLKNSYIPDISGANDVSKGIRQEGLSSGIAITSLQEAAQTRIRQKSRNLDVALQDMGQIYLNHVLNFYTVPMVFRITNNQNAQKYFKFHVEQSEDGKKVAKIRDAYTNQEGALVYGEERAIPLNGALDVKVTTGSTLPFARAQKESQAFNLFDRKIIDAQQVLSDIQYPNAEAIIARMKEMAAQAPPPTAG